MSARSAGVLLLAFCVYALGPCNAADVSYTLPVLNHTYVSNPRFVARGLAPLYDIVKSFLRGIQHDDMLPPDLMLVINGTIQVNTEVNPGSVAKFYVGILAVLCIGLAVVLLAPCAGLILCCCCGSKKHKSTRLLDDDDQTPDRKQKQPSGAPLLAPLVLSSITCIIVAGVAITFAANAYVEYGVRGIGQHVTSATADVRLYMDNAQTEVDTILGVNYDELSAALDKVLEDARTDTNAIVTGFVNGLPLDTLDKMANGIETINKDLNDIHSGIDICTTSLDKIIKEINAANSDVVDLCRNLGSGCPAELQTFRDDLKPPNVNPLPRKDIDESISAVTNILQNDFGTQLKQGQEQINSLGNKAETVVNDTIATVKDTINEKKASLQKTASDLVQSATNASSTFDTVDEKVLEIQDKYNTLYAGYRMVFFAVYSAVILIIAALITLGLVCGCSSKHSYSFLNIPVTMIFLIMSVWMLIVMVLFITGVTTDRACEFLRKPGDQQQLSHLLDDFLQQSREQMANSSELPPLRNISFYIEECRQDKTMYEVIGLESTIHIDDIVKYVDDFDFNQYLEKVNQTMKDVVNVKLLSPDIRKQIENLQKSEVSQLNLTNLISELESFRQESEPLSSLGAQWAQQLKQLGDKYTIDVNTTVSRLEAVSTEADGLQKSTVSLAGSLHSLDTDLKLGHDSFPDALQWLLDQATAADQSVAKSAPRVSEIAVNTADGFRKEARAYLQWAVDRVKFYALKCRPIINIYDTMVMAVCDEIISPWNAFWAMSGLCLLLLIPAAFLASHLASHKS